MESDDVFPPLVTKELVSKVCFSLFTREGVNVVGMSAGAVTGTEQAHLLTRTDMVHFMENVRGLNY